MTAGSLRSELLAISGIESAEIEGDDGAPSGVKVRLAPGADAITVSEQVQRVLAAHGLSSELSPEEGAAVPPQSQERFLAPAPEPDDVEAIAEAVEAAVEEEAPGSAAQPAPPAVVIEHSIPPPVDRAKWLASIAVEEDREGVSVVATADDGTSVTRRASADGRGLDEAVVGAVCALVDPTLPIPVVVAVGDRDVDGSTVLTLVLALGDRRVAGSTIVEGGRPYAVGRAAWAALSAR